MTIDERLRESGYEIADRPNNAEPTWTLFDLCHRPIVTFTQSQALASIAEHQEHHTPEKRKESIMRTAAIAILFLILGAAVSCAAPPDRKPPTPPVVIPDLAGTWQSEWSEGNGGADTLDFVIEQEGRTLTISVGEWSAIGVVNADGSVVIRWVLDRGYQAVSLLKIDRDGSLAGCWGWGRGPFVDENGDLRGEAGRERVRRVEPEPPTIN